MFNPPSPSSSPPFLPSSSPSSSQSPPFPFSHPTPHLSSNPLLSPPSPLITLPTSRDISFEIHRRRMKTALEENQPVCLLTFFSDAITEHRQTQILQTLDKGKGSLILPPFLSTVAEGVNNSLIVFFPPPSSLLLPSPPLLLPSPPFSSFPLPLFFPSSSLLSFSFPSYFIPSPSSQQLQRR